jgi:adenosylcobinamide-GDP ribazoletransferase
MMRAALVFLTVIGRSTAPTRRSLIWFPVIGALIGLAVGGVWTGTSHAWPVMVAAALTVAFDALLTGGLHWDGLADSGDGLLPALETERRLEVMTDPRIGAFGALAIAFVLLLRYSALLAGPVGVWIVAALWCASRALAVVVMSAGRYARSQGMADAFFATGGQRSQTAVATASLGLAISVPLSLIDRPGHGAAAIGAELATFGAMTWFANRRLAGYTGDVLGAQIVLGETIGLLVWAARW